MSKCLNCGESFSGNYCFNCGQSDKVSRYSLKSLMKEISKSLELDSDFMRTFKALFIRPGIFIRNYLLG
ncbi:MAG TPA: hypothetical protein VLN45_08290, partial [Ignavibacteriaceae bacterium]|nr:hypothetical protein [Ignavibacteriaceae bacterium]